MIGKALGAGSGFGGLQQYLLHGRNGASPDRSVWASTRNLPDPDPERAAAVMEATAGASTRVERPVYHVVVSLAPGEKLERGALEGVADRLLSDLGLSEHQALIAEHADGAQQHIHLMVNRVHPDTGRAWKASHDYQRIERSLRAQERELDLKIVPGRHSPVPGHDRYLGTRPARGAFADRVRDIAGESLGKAESWQEVHASLSPKGLTLQPSRSGRGLVVTDGQRYVAASRLGREFGKPQLEARLGKFQGLSPDLKRIQEISREIDQHRKLEYLRSRWQGASRDLREARDVYERASVQLDRASAGLDRTLARAYRDPASARARIEVTIKQKGARWTAKALEQNPAGAGRLIGRVASKARGQARDVVRGQVTYSIRDYAHAVAVKQRALERLQVFRRHPRQPVLEATGRAAGVLGRGLRRLSQIEQRYAPEKRIEAEAKRIVERVGWRAVEKMLPVSGVQALRIAVSLVRSVERVVDRGLER